MEKPKTTQAGVPMYPKGMPVSAVQFPINPGLPEVQAAARERGWAEVSAEAEEIHYTSNGWKTGRVVKCTDQPPPFAPDGRIFLAGVKQGTKVEFAIQVGIHKAAGTEEEDSARIWLNNGGKNYQQVTR